MVTAGAREEVALRTAGWAPVERPTWHDLSESLPSSRPWHPAPGSTSQTRAAPPHPPQQYEHWAFEEARFSRVGDRVRVNECVVSPRDPVVRAPVPLVPANYSMGNLLYLYVPPCCRSPSPPSSTRPHPDVFVSSGYKTGGSLGPPISPPPWGDMTDE
ncbi:unnamed protein product [Pleuronectes platessa]|uniref:Uncharacterized protein n=1 Tax=Pleuronectes platessa TaxID=8262 RepID=A0A9N7U114_PLEPL|nr:unnamed protein product [Pleuronectes platessa]